MIRLNEEWTAVVIDLPESRSGAHIVDITLRSGAALENVLIFNCEEVQVDAGSFNVNDITAIELHQSTR